MNIPYIFIKKIIQYKSQSQPEDQINDDIDLNGKTTETPRIKRKYVRKTKTNQVKQNEIEIEIFKGKKDVNMSKSKNSIESDSFRENSPELLLLIVKALINKRKLSTIIKKS